MLLVPLVSSSAGSIACRLCQCFLGHTGDLHEFLDVPTLEESVDAHQKTLVHVFILDSLEGCTTMSNVMQRKGHAHCIIHWRQTYAEEKEFVNARVNNFHIGYFLSIAILEVINARFLIAKFRKDHLTHKRAFTELHQIIAKGSENRLACLTLIGVLRAISYLFQQNPQSASKDIGELDRSAYALSTLYPYVLLIDHLTTKATTPEAKAHGKPPRRTEC
ncbi:hypothetical protein DFJ77DRAFT_541562 [Powellomyces hirtus]|nr:hypothetical protein DFJ77DRAFT_541562 [Powellomyces hirtus]